MPKHDLSGHSKVMVSVSTCLNHELLLGEGEEMWHYLQNLKAFAGSVERALVERPRVPSSDIGNQHVDIQQYTGIPPRS